jgi:ATP-dependent Clp protease adaptor protein ClpS
MSQNNQTIFQEEEELLILDDKGSILVLHNDDFNTFDFVIESLVEVCNHSPEQAEQCAYIVHFNGKCDVKKGPESVLTKMYSKLKSRGLTVTLD